MTKDSAFYIEDELIDLMTAAELIEYEVMLRTEYARTEPQVGKGRSEPALTVDER